MSGREVPKITLTAAEAADALSISLDSLERYVQPEVRVIRRGRLRLFPVRELETWARDNAARTLGEEVA
jgi:hypothetical protein